MNKNLEMFIVVLITISIIIFFIGVIDAYGELPDFVWVSSSEGEFRKVNIYYVDEVTQCDVYHKDYEARGCYLSGISEAIYIDKDEVFSWSKQGCNVYSHEVYHAWGYHHHYGPLSYTCVNPEWGNQHYKIPMDFNPDYIKHRNPELFIDSDADGIIDEKDECPTDPETFNRYLDHDGCPDFVPKWKLSGRY